MITSKVMHMPYGGTASIKAALNGVPLKELRQQADKLVAEIKSHPPTKRRSTVSNRKSQKILTPAQRQERNQAIGKYQIVQAELTARALKLMANDIRQSLRGLRSNLKQITK